MNHPAPLCHTAQITGLSSYFKLYDLQTAITVAKSVIGSSLFKCAMFGGDANWGRILLSDDIAASVVIKFKVVAIFG